MRLSVYCDACRTFRPLELPVELSTGEPADVCCPVCDKLIIVVRREPDIVTVDVPSDPSMPTRLVD